MDECTLVYCVDYGSNKDGSYLSPMGVRTLQDGIGYLNGRPAGQHILGFCGADLPDMGMVAREGLMWKNAIVEDRLRVEVARFPIKARNSIEEARNMKAALDPLGISPARIILYCEWWHSWRVGMVWRHVFPGCTVELRTMSWMDSDDYILPKMRNKRQWIFYNLKGFAGTIAWAYFRQEWVANLRQPIKS